MKISLFMVSSCIRAGVDKGGDSYGTCVQFQVRMLPALAFLPPAEVAEAFEDVMTLFPPEALQIALYFEDTYIGRRRRNGLLSATFPTSIWSVHRSVVEGLPRTNNSAEAWHRSFQVCIILIFSDSPFSLPELYQLLSLNVFSRTSTAPGRASGLSLDAFRKSSPCKR